jgi:DNA-binding CsgD family transcriptional regulator
VGRALLAAALRVVADATIARVSGVLGTRAAAGLGPVMTWPAGEMLLERAEALAVLAGELDALVGIGDGRLVLIGGEAGIGKSALVNAFCSGLGAVRVLSGACDALLTPRPLGPLVDIAEQTGGQLADLVQAGASPGELLAGLARELRPRSPSVVVLEDLHWADEATLDVFRLLGRRIGTVPALVLATYRDDELDRVHPLRLVLGELPRAGVRRLSLAPLSVRAVASLAGPHRTDPDRLHQRTAGNPFFVTEALAAGVLLPDSVRDAVLARAARLDGGARALLDAVAITPPHAELWLLQALGGDEFARLEECIASGMLRAGGEAVAFRHEIARVAIEDALPPDRVLALHRLALQALLAQPGVKVDLARLVHHAEAACDGNAVLRYAPEAGERAALLGAHREAAAQFARALRFAERLESHERAGLLERLSYECYLTDAMGEAIDARRAALAEHRRRGDRLREGDGHRWLSRLSWFGGDNTTAQTEARQAVELLQTLPPGRELAMAYSNMAQLRMNADDVAGTRVWGARAIELAERLGEPEILVHALNNVGTAELMGGELDGAAKVERSAALAREQGLDEHVARAHTNLACGWIERRDYALGDRQLEQGIEYCRERDLGSWLLYMTGWRARSQLEQGHWEEAAACATVVLDRPDVAAPSRITPLAVLGRLRARRGDPDPFTPLNEASELARATGEIQRLLPVALARAEARWLAGEPTLVAAETDAVLELAIEHQRAWGVGELLLWRRRAAIAEQARPVSVAEPFRLELDGAAASAASLWTKLGCPYESALALLGSDDETDLRRSHDEFRQLGASRAAAHAARKLRERGVRGLQLGPRGSTRANPAGLTRRELDVLALLAEGMRNAQIAERLVLSSKTVDHHVSAILRKLDVRTRGEAGAAAVRLGLTAQDR